MRTSVDYDRHQHAVYSRGRSLPPARAKLWAGVFGKYIGEIVRPTILDLGSGTGIYSLLLAEAFDAEVIGVEPAARMREVAAREHGHPRVRYLEGSAERIPLPDGCSDVALLSSVAHHIGDREACVHELRRVLRAGGLVLVRGVLPRSLAQLGFTEFFPAARPIAERQSLALAELVQGFERGGFERVADEVIEDAVAPDLRAYCERVELRAISTLELIGDTEFEDGMARMRAAAERGSSRSRPVVEQLDLIVLRAAHGMHR